MSEFTEGSRSREAVRCWRAGSAQAWMARGASHATAQTPRADAALRAAARLRDAVPLLHAAQHVQVHTHTHTGAGFIHSLNLPLLNISFPFFIAEINCT